MNSKLIPILAGLMFFSSSSVYSDPKPLGRSGSRRAQQQDNAETDHDLVQRLIQKARDKFEAGNFGAADKILRAALELEPRNNEAWYYSDLLQRTIQENKNRNIRWWYAAIPPRPVHE